MVEAKDSLLAHCSDPVEMRRLNYQTPGMDTHTQHTPDIHINTTHTPQTYFLTVWSYNVVLKHLNSVSELL